METKRKGLALFRLGRIKGPPTSFSPVTYTNVRISSQNFLTFIFKHFVPLVSNTGGNTWYESQIIELEPRPPLNESDFSGQILIKLSL